MTDSSHWGQTLIDTRAAQKLPPDLIDSVDEIITWVASFDSADDELAQRFAEITGSDQLAKQRLLSILDRWLLSEPLSARRVFGARAVRKRDEESIRLRYKRLSRLFHPDRGIADAEWLTERMTRINDAYARAQELCSQPESNGTDIVFDTTPAPEYRRADEVYSQSEQDWDKTWNTAYSALVGFVQRLTVGKLLVWSLLLGGALVGLTALVSYLQPNPPIDAQMTQLPVKESLPVDVEAAVQEEADISGLLDDLIAQTSTRDTRLVPDSDQNAGSEDDRIQQIIAEYNAQQVFGVAKSGNERASKPVASKNKQAVVKTATQKQAIAVNESEVSVAEINTKSAESNTLPSEVTDLLDSLEASFSSASAQDFGGYFSVNAQYFGEAGRAKIVATSADLFRGISSPKLDYRVARYREMPGWHLLEGDQKLQFRSADQLVRFCQPFSMMIRRLEHKIEIYNVEEYLHPRSSC